MQKSLFFLESFGFAVNSLCEVTRNLEMNAEGLYRCYHSFLSLFSRMKDSSSACLLWFLGLFRRVFKYMVDKVKRLFKGAASLMRLDKLAFRKIVVNSAMTAMTLVLVYSFVPQQKNTLDSLYSQSL